ncbi:MAG TPA: hypothetical protein VFA27_03255 [Vicinamibacterales bacterium]|nr:hypothetical protein [Vicinamibacterales bacterium]
MKRRTLLHSLAAALAALAMRPLRVLAQGARAASSTRELTPDAIAMLHEIAPTVLPSALGARGARDVADRFVQWVRQYEEGVALAHGYGHPRLQKSGPTPAPQYVAQLAALDREARAHGARWSALDRETQRAILDAAFAAAGVRTLPPRPMGQHVIVDLMAIYFRSSQANDDCYRAQIGRETCRPIAITVRAPAPLR